MVSSMRNLSKVLQLLRRFTAVIYDNLHGQFAMQSFMSQALTSYDNIRGGETSKLGYAFWDVVVLTAINEDQKNVYLQQIQQKRGRRELPCDVQILVWADPPGPKLGNGGSTITCVQHLYEKFGEKLYDYRVLLIHAGGLSQRMPSVSVLGKIFSPIPRGNPLYQMLDTKLAMFCPLIPKMPPGIFVTCADDFLIFSLGENHEAIRFAEEGFTALAHPSPVSVGVSHGVYVIKDIEKVDPSVPLQECECLQVLQKPSESLMYEKGAMLKKEGSVFGNGIKIRGRAVYTDSSFFFAHDITKKLQQFLLDYGPLEGEIDAYGDFLQALGENATSDYIRNISNISSPTPTLLKTRQLVFDTLKGSVLRLLVMNSSKFVHIGTTKEYIENFCCNSSFQTELGLEKDVFNVWTKDNTTCGLETGFGDSDQPPSKVMRLSDISLGCVMHSYLPLDSHVSSTAVLEYCYFGIPVRVGTSCILSNCEFEPKVKVKDSEGGVQFSLDYLNSLKSLDVPNDLFIHTVPILHDGKTRYVTVFLDINDSMKRAAPGDDVKKLPFLGKLVEDYTAMLNVDLTKVQPESKVTLWTANLFPVTDDMSESFLLALQCIQAVKKDSPKLTSLASFSLVSMETILKIKDLDTMLEKKNALYNKIKSVYMFLQKDDESRNLAEFLFLELTCNMVFSAIDRYITVSGVSWLGWYMRRKLEEQTKDIHKAQHETLMERLQENADTEYGKRFKFKEIKEREEFVKFHPLTRYPHYEPYIERMMKGEKNVLTKDDPVIFAVTSGTSGKSSIIPMIKKQQSLFFSQGIAVVYDCMRSGFPQFSYQQKDMKFFYTPRLRTAECGTPIGPNSSSPANSKRILSMYSTPKAGFEIQTEPEAMYVHLLFGLKDRNLGNIEANFASLVYAAFRALDANWDSLVDDVENGTVSDNLQIEEEVRKELNQSMSADPKRALELRQAREQGLVGLAGRIWPKLHFVMSADSGTFELYGNRLRELYCAGTPIYSPLYAASEGLLGVNIWPRERPSRYLLMPRSMFFEFIPVQNCEQEQPKTLFLDQVEIDQQYELVITNASGLYRYRFGDVIKVVGFHNQCPVIEFQYRQGQFLNVRGEKVSENYFFQALSSAVQKAGVRMVDYCCTESIMVDQVLQDNGDKQKKKSEVAPCYHVFIELEEDEKIKAKISIDEELKALSYVYASFRRKGSIGPMKVYIVKPGTFRDLRAFMIETTTSSPNQYKVPRVIKKSEAVKFILDRIDVCML